MFGVSQTFVSVQSIIMDSLPQAILEWPEIFFPQVVWCNVCRCPVFTGSCCSVAEIMLIEANTDVFLLIFTFCRDYFMPYFFRIFRICFWMDSAQSVYPWSPG